MHITLRQFHAVLAVNRLGKINLAARELGLTPSAVTLQIQQVEAELKSALFDRTRDGFRATAAGLAVVAAAQAIDARMNQLADDLTGLRESGRGILRFGAVSTAKYFAPALTAAFMAEFPGIEVSLRIGNRAAISADLAERNVDVALMGRPPWQVAVQSFLLGEHPLVIIAAPGHALATAQRISKWRIAQETFLVREHGSGTRSSLELFFADIPGRTDRLGPEFGSNESIKQAVMANLGVAFISAHTIATEVELGRLVILDVIDTPVRRQWFAVNLLDRTPSPAALAFRDFIVRRGAEFLPTVARMEQPLITPA
ncbi:LysR family transcriptional regulator [Novosphingobium sp.]|uniref:LysR family transcriptional regulator n=1 Tax=Novosphingobium sp. TaxID=1874826 RepID=UPI00333F04AB